MRISDLLSMGLKNLWRRKSRTFLTIFGVLVGSVSVVLMISIALGAERSQLQMIQEFGNVRVITVNDNVGRGGIKEEGPKAKAGSKDKTLKLNEEGLAELKQLAHVEAILPMYQESVLFKAGRKQNHAYITAADFATLEKFGFKIGKGRIPEKGEKAIVGGEDFKYGFYDPNNFNDINWGEDTEDFFGKTYKTYYRDERDDKGNKKRPVNFEVVGVAKEQTEYAYSTLMDIETFLELKENDIRKYGDYKAYRKDPDRYNYSQVKVLVDDMNNVLDVSEEIKALGFQAYNEMEWVNQLKKQSSMMTMVLGGIGAVALFVAAIGIANTMVMSIYERTREIGVMKVLGCEVYDILKLFLLEAAIIGFIGGVIGLGLSYIGSDIINKAAMGGGEGLDMALGMGGGLEISYIPLWLALVSLAFSTLIGVVAGILPAIRATKLSALEAIKTDG